MHAGAPCLILDNKNGCVVNGIANGSRCIMKGLAWDDADVNQQIVDGIISCESDIYDVPRPPDYIIVSVMAPGGGAMTPEAVSKWPETMNLNDYSENVNELQAFIT